MKNQVDGEMSERFLSSEGISLDGCDEEKSEDAGKTSIFIPSAPVRLSSRATLTSCPLGFIATDRGSQYLIRLWLNIHHDSQDTDK